MWSVEFNLKFTALIKSEICAMMGKILTGGQHLAQQKDTRAPHQRAWVTFPALVRGSRFLFMQILGGSSDDSRKGVLSTHIRDLG